MHSPRLQNRGFAVWGALVLLAMGSSVGWGQTSKPATGSAAGAEKSPWTALPNSALPAKNAAGDKLATLSAGVIVAVGVDAGNGDVYVILNKSGGIWKSTDQGETFKECGHLQVEHPVYYPASVCVDPAGKGVAFFVQYGEGCLTTDSGKTWNVFKPDAAMAKKSFHFGVVTWEAPTKTILAMAHEDQGKLLLSLDGGTTWTVAAKGFPDIGPIGIFDEKTFVARKWPSELQRTTDQGATWKKVADLAGMKVGQVVNVYKGVGYLMTDKGLMVSKDKGATWDFQGSAVNASIGPYIVDENHIAAIGPEGCYETLDAGKTWTMVCPLSKGDNYPLFKSYAYDPVHDVFYYAQGQKAMKCAVKSTTAPAGNDK